MDSRASDITPPTVSWKTLPLPLSEDQLAPVRPRDRVPPEVLRQQAAEVGAGLGLLLNAVPAALLVLNTSRQVLYANQAALAMLGDIPVDSICGSRPGVLLACEHACEAPDGCGTTAACMACGAAQALSACERCAASIAECRITQGTTGRALDLRVAASPLTLKGTQYTMLSLTDIGHEKRRHALERVFFHDLLNTLSGVAGCAELLVRSTPEELPELRVTILQAVADMAEEIRSQRDLVAAETGELRVVHEPLDSLAVLEHTARIYRHHKLQRTIHIAPSAASVQFPCDRTLLTRVLGNMVKNAIEAVGHDQSVSLACRVTADEVVFSVHNPGAMPRAVQLQVFQRSFSTKGRGRGLGTYSIKLLTERYLNGRAWFTSTPESGTIFYAAFATAGH